MSRRREPQRAVTLTLHKRLSATSKGELPAPRPQHVWCDRCRLSGLMLAAQHPADDVALVESPTGLLSLVCPACLRPEDRVVDRGHTYRDPSYQPEVANA